MTPEEQNYRERSKLLYQAGLAETNPNLRDALLLQSERVAMKALAFDLARKQAMLTFLGIPLNA
jgi:hypothetical protein